MKFVRRQEEEFSFGNSGHGARNVLFDSMAKIKKQIEALRLRDATEEMDYREVPHKLRRIIASVRAQGAEGPEWEEAESIATPKDMRERMRKQLQKCQELARVGKLTPEWCEYLDKHFVSGARKEAR